MEFSKDSNLPLYKQVVAWFEEQVDTGQFEPGDRVPSTNALAEELGIGRKAVQQGLEILAERGFFERSPGRGTFIAPNIQDNTIVIVFPSELLIDETFGFYRLVCSEFLRKGPKMGYQISLTILTDDDSEQQVREDLERRMAAGRIRGIINFTNIRFSGAVTHEVHGIVEVKTSTRDSIAFRALNYVLARGFGSVALLEHSAGPGPTNLVQNAIRLIHDDYASDAEIRAYRGDNADESLSGRNMIHKILDEFTPEVLVVTDDNLARGVIFGLMERGKRIPDDIALITHANKNSPICSPVPLTMLENDPQAFALETLKSIIAKFEGRAFVPAGMKAKLIIGKSCGE